MKICPACHQDTFDGRSTCHRCGSDVSDSLPLELPTTDAATLVGRLPLMSKKGHLHLDVSGVRFETLSGQQALQIAARDIRAVEPRGAGEMILTYRSGDALQGQSDARVRLRVRWAPRADRRTVRGQQDVLVVAQTWRPMVFTGSNRRRTMRDHEIVRDRWIWSIRSLLQTDRYAVR